MDTLECIRTKVEVRQFAEKPVPHDVAMNVLEAARMTGSSNNTQHWRFILLENKETIRRLASDSTTGMWVAGAGFAVIILTNPDVRGHLIDAGRALQDMQLAAWNQGVGSGIFTGVSDEKLRKDFGIPAQLNVSAIVGFGYPQKKVNGKKKKRNPLNQIAFAEKFGQSLGSGSS